MLSSFWCWLERWQDLIAGFVGAGAVLITVRWTLLSERRRREEELKSLRTALGAELRQFAGRALDGCLQIIGLLNATDIWAMVDVSSRRLESIVRFPDPVIYPHAGASLGAFGDRAHDIVYFFGQVKIVELATESIPPGQIQFARGLLISFARGLFNASEAAVRALPAFESPTWAANDVQYVSELEKLRASVEGITA